MNAQLNAYLKCVKVIESCETVEQAIVAAKMVDNFADSFGTNKLWYKLEMKATSKIFARMKGE